MPHSARGKRPEAGRVQGNDGSDGALGALLSVGHPASKLAGHLVRLSPGQLVTHSVSQAICRSFFCTVHQPASCRPVFKSVSQSVRPSVIKRV
eukprot:scaffold116205_cov32-Prasinocladus_malaysianus.AAC.1